MTTLEWLEQAKANQAKLRSLIANYHPAMPDGPAHEGERALPITAKAAEAASVLVRAQIAKEHTGPMPVTQFDNALDAKDFSKAYSLIQGAWFGVPESTGCWSIEGFKEAVELLDDPPEEEE